MANEAEKRSRVITLVIAIALLALVPIAYFVFLREPPPPPMAPPPAAPPAPPAPQAPELRLSRLDGEVMVHRKGADGGWMAATQGQRLEVDDEIRTAPGASVEIAAGEAYTFRLEPGTVLGVEEIEATVSRFLLQRGMVNANVSSGTQQVKVRGEGSDAVATSKGGEFIMTNNGQGTVAVGSLKGDLEFSAAGKAVIVRTGQSSLVQGQGPPSAPAPIPASLFLKVQWPQITETNRRQVVVTGRTLPGSHVVVGSSVMTVERDGRFRGVVSLRVGRNNLSWKCRDVGGHVATSDKRIMLDSRAPNISTEKLPWEKR